MTTRPAATRGRPGNALLPAAAALALGFAAAAYLRLVRPGVLNWGATVEEAHRPMPGDELLRRAALQTTRAVTVDAPASDIWPWLVQMGPRPRAGVYTYDWIERLLGIDIRNSDRILPEYQHLEAGDYIGLKQRQGLVARDVQPQRFLVLQWVPANSTWTFGLYAQDNGSTRLVSRNRLPGSGPLFWLAMVGCMEPGSLLMERKMLLGLKARAERLNTPTVARDP